MLNDENIILGQKIRNLRKKRGLSQKDLYKITGIPNCNISAYEKGLRCPRDQNMKKIIIALKPSSEDMTEIIKLFCEAYTKANEKPKKEKPPKETLFHKYIEAAEG